MEQSDKYFDHTERTPIYWWRKESLSLREMARRFHPHYPRDWGSGYY